METITIRKRKMPDGKVQHYKKFNDYDKGLWGRRISAKEYYETLNEVGERSTMNSSVEMFKVFGIIEEYTYEN